MAKNLYQKINAVMLEVTSVIKDAEIKMGSDRSYMAVSHDAVTKALHIPLAKNGIVLHVNMINCEKSSFEQTKFSYGKETKAMVYRADVKVNISLIDADSPETKLQSTFEAMAFDSGDKAIGKALSMAVKNGLLKLFMLESLDQEEHRPTEEAEYSQAYKPAKPPEPKTVVNHAAPAVNSSNINNLYIAAKKHKWTEENLKQVCFKMFKVKSLVELNDEQFKRITKFISDGLTYEVLIKMSEQ